MYHIFGTGMPLFRLDPLNGGFPLGLSFKTTTKRVYSKALFSRCLPVLQDTVMTEYNFKQVEAHELNWLSCRVVRCKHSHVQCGSGGLWVFPTLFTHTLEIPNVSAGSLFGLK